MPSVSGGGDPDQWLSVEERREWGRSRRSLLPRSALADIVTGPPRPDPVTLLSSQDVSRIPDLVPIRYGRMLASPSAFYRGAALIMASDLSNGPHTGLTTQLCGDAHLGNFGLFGSPERNLVFDINDFDETLPGPWEWDLKRLAGSLAIAARDNGFDRETRDQVVRSCARAYRERMAALATMGELEVWYAQARIDDALLAGLRPQAADTVRRIADKARSRDNLQALSKLTEVVDGRHRLISNPPLLIPIEELVDQSRVKSYEQKMAALVDAYRKTLNVSVRVLARRFRYAGMARKVVGVGSVGLRTWVVLTLGRDGGDPLMLQVKEARPSVLEAYLGPSVHSNAAQRVVVGQRMTQSSGDIMLGWLRTVGPDGHRGDYYIRQLHDWKGSASAESMNPPAMTDYGRSCAHVLAGAHARTGDRIAIAAYLGKGETADLAISHFAATYAKQNQRDYETLRAAARENRVHPIVER